jgi:hypothetical protein
MYLRINTNLETRKMIAAPAPLSAAIRQKTRHARSGGDPVARALASP